MIIQKKIKTTLEEINALKLSQVFKLENEHYLLKGYDVYIDKVERGYSAKIKFKPFNGYGSTQMHSIELQQPIKLINKEKEYYIPEHSIHLNQQISNIFSEEVNIDIIGTLDRFSTAEKDLDFDNTYLRFVIPLGHSLRGKLDEVRGWHYETDLPILENKTLLKVIINEIEYHFFEFRLGKEESYLVIDSTASCILSEFINISHSILLGHGFLYGNVYLDEGYILSSTDKEFNRIVNASFSIYRKSIKTIYRMHTTNAYSVHDMTSKDEAENMAKMEEVKKWINDIIEIEGSIFSKLCELIYNKEPISRAVLNTIQGNLLSIELKGSAYSIALEAITKVFMEEQNEKSPKPLEKPLFKKLKDKLFVALDEMLPPDIEKYKNVRAILKTRIDNLNSPTNSDKLQKSFDLVGYTLKEYERTALMTRNKFQHGELPASDDTHDVVFKEVYFMTIIMHRLIYTLVLKRIGYEGYIINYPQLHSHITEKDLKEPVFYKL